MDRLKGKVAIVTGGASGIGEGIARLFTKEGARVAIADLQDDLGNKIAKDIDGPYVRTDVSRSEEVRNLVETATGRFGRLDILVNAAGIIFSGVPVLDHTEEAFDRTIAVNLKGPWLCMKHAIPAMSGADGGAIVNIASIAASIGMIGQSAYGASKGGLVQLTKHIAADVADRGIRVNSVSPGGTVTGMSFRVRPGVSREEVIKDNAGRNPLGRTGWPEDMAYAALWLASDEARYVTAQNIIVDGGTTGIRPRIDLATRWR